MDVMDYIPPEEVLERIRALRRCQQYLSQLPGGAVKRDLNTAIEMAFDLIGEILECHGICQLEDRISFEKGNLMLWDGIHIRGPLQ